MRENLFHYTTEADWDRAVAQGEYRVSGRGMSLESEGFIHLCYPAQRAGVWQRYWADVDLAAEPVLLLSVDPDDLDSGSLVDENTSGGTELFPHLYGPLPLGAVSAAHPVGPDGLPRLSTTPLL